MFMIIVCFLCGNGAISLDIIHYFELNNLGTVRRTKKKSGDFACSQQQRHGDKLATRATTIIQAGVITTEIVVIKLPMQYNHS